jgi:hypothetical protein
MLLLPALGIGQITVWKSDLYDADTVSTTIDTVQGIGLFVLDWDNGQIAVNVVKAIVKRIKLRYRWSLDDFNTSETIGYLVPAHCDSGPNEATIRFIVGCEKFREPDYIQLFIPKPKQ